MPEWCQFVTAASNTIRCTRCGCLRTTAANPASYHRLCDLGEPNRLLENPAIDRAASIMRAPCRHRGEVVEQGVCNVCGFKGQPYDVYACALHGRCMVRRYRNDRADVRVCMSCEDYATVDAVAS
jgi:hypothetical protein